MEKKCFFFIHHQASQYWIKTNMVKQINLKSNINYILKENSLPSKVSYDILYQHHKCESWKKMVRQVKQTIKRIQKRKKGTAIYKSRNIPKRTNKIVHQWLNNLKLISNINFLNPNRVQVVHYHFCATKFLKASIPFLLIRHNHRITLKLRRMWCFSEKYYLYI